MPPSLLMPDGQDVGILPMPSELTITQAAKILDMSVACVNSFLDDGTIESRWENGTRLIQPDSFWEFESDYREGREAMADLTRWAQEMGMYDD